MPYIFWLVGGGDLVLDNAGSNDNQAHVKVHRYIEGNDSQLWDLEQYDIDNMRYWKIVCVASGKLLTVNNAHHEGASVEQFERLTHNVPPDRQLWEFRAGKFRSYANPRDLSVDSREDGAEVKVHRFTNTFG